MKTFLKNSVVRILTWEAKRVLARTNPRIIAVTGTVGKTGAKDAIAAALAPFGSVRKSEKSFNSEIGVPLAILNLPNPWSNPLRWVGVLLRGFIFAFTTHYKLPTTHFLILEIGTDRPGDIRSITTWLKPEIVVVTRLSHAPVHVENFSSVGELIAEKGALVKSVRPGGILILNADDSDVLAYRALAPQGTRVISYGLSDKADVHADIYRDTLARMPFRTHQYAVLAGCAVAHALGFDTTRATKVLAHYTGAPGRLRVLAGINGSILIDDSYNSSPVAAEEALRALAEYKTGGRRIAVLGDMLELGEFSAREHTRILERALASADLVLIVGLQFTNTARSWSNGKPDKVQVYLDARAAGAALAQELRADDVALIKGSQGLRMERAVALFLRDQSRASELLVRQEKEWRKR